MANSGLMSKVLSSIQTQLEAALTGLDLRMREAQLQARGEISRGDPENPSAIKKKINQLSLR